MNKIPISLRLPKQLIEELKLLAELKGVRYQTLIGAVLKKSVSQLRKEIHSG